ncbi:dockerin type I domain-containing protein [Tundrisphaera sp. TA3]|uniref:dockerin type I domain-containing protein n=1 Tax=Tundrisphaera sp. TA3 TaxID=3435775 RepID=UPI003EB87957
MNTSQPTPKRRRTPTLSAEGLETRQLMTGGVGNTFAIVPATLNKPGGQVSVSFVLDPKLISVPKGKKSIVLGLDVAPDSGSAASPVVKSVTAPGGKVLKVTNAVYDKAVKKGGNDGNGNKSSAVTVTIPTRDLLAGKAQTYKVNVRGANAKTGDMLVGFFIPGDADGNGIVDTADSNATSYAMGAVATSTTSTAAADTSKYDFDIDSNRNGRIDKADLNFVNKNKGLKVLVSPVITANLDPASDSGLADRITNIPDIKINGTATPGASITYSEASDKTTPVTTMADVAGNYTINVRLGEGSNTFKVETRDGFNQKIVGTIAPITYSTTAT